MATLLKRLSMSLDLERRGTSQLNERSLPEPSSARASTIAASGSFNDFSMHISQEEEHHHAPEAAGFQSSANADIPQPHRSLRSGQSPFSVGSAPAGLLSPIATKALTIPRKSVAAILGRESMGTPRSPLDDASPGSVATPCAPVSADDSQPLSPRPRPSLDDNSPASPHSPTTPGGRRRRAQKIHGMDYYEFCELVRAGSSM